MEKLKNKMKVVMRYDQRVEKVYFSGVQTETIGEAEGNLVEYLKGSDGGGGVNVQRIMRAYENLMKNLPKELRGKINSRLEITLTK
jgi:hypothetical protein